MGFDLSKLKTNFVPVAAETVVVPPAPAVLINRPTSQRPVVTPAEALTVTTIEGSAAAHALVEFVDVAEDEDAAPEVAPEPPKARRGRPRKTPGTAPSQPATPTTEAEPADPKALTAPAPTASGCAPSVGDLAAAVNALFSAVRSLETTGTTGRYLQDAEEAMQRFGGVL